MLTDKETKQLKEYRKQLAMPAWAYVMIHGVLAWGVTTAVLVSLAYVLIGDISFAEMWRKDLWINLIGFPVGGIFFGIWMRRFIKRQAAKLAQKESIME